MDDQAKGKLDAKRFNEHAKLITTSVNAIAVVILAGALFQPLLSTGLASAELRRINWPWAALAVALHLFAHVPVRFIRPE